MKLLTAIAVLAMAAVASADIYVPDGQFEKADHSADWVTAQGGGATTFAYPTTGGNGGGYATMAKSGGWGVLVNPIVAGTEGGGVTIGSMGVTAGATNTFTVDLITILGTATGAMKVEAWGSNANLGNSGEIAPASASAIWQTLTFDWLVPVGADKLIFVPVAGEASTIGYDNVGVVPEPATMGLFAVAAGFLMFVRRFRA